MLACHVRLRKFERICRFTTPSAGENTDEGGAILIGCVRKSEEEKKKGRLEEG